MLVWQHHKHVTHASNQDPNNNISPRARLIQLTLIPVRWYVQIVHFIYFKTTFNIISWIIFDWMIMIFSIFDFLWFIIFVTLLKEFIDFKLPIMRFLQCRSIIHVNLGISFAAIIYPNRSWFGQHITLYQPFTSNLNDLICNTAMHTSSMSNSMHIVIHCRNHSMSPKLQTMAETTNTQVE